VPGSRFVVSGHVQGVGFRAFVRSLAQNLGIDGAAWNTSAGDVEIFAQHDQESTLDEFERSLWSGPGWVRGVDRFALFEVQEPGLKILPTR
jgi:acylphosphatase